ncbi:calcyclin-binding protein [Calliopsis andreniformis]|uniref:calcyclin-binding protein n=1 Tax=Calliopsis andreniformis TaxID=337506 RepID=UPI003FCD735C
MMSTKADELKLDLEEVNSLLQQANRQRNKDLLSLEARRLQTELAKLLEEKITSLKPTPAMPNVTNKHYEVKLNNYGWDQTSTSVKLYIDLKDVQQLPKEAVTCNFTEKSLDLCVEGLNNKNYRLTINNLCEEIDVNTSNIKIKTDMIIISLAKKVAKNWSHVTGIEKRIKESKVSAMTDMGDSEKDPDKSLMNLMKKMYMEGDDELKRTIAKAWTESQLKKTDGSLDYS